MAYMKRVSTLSVFVLLVAFVSLVSASDCDDFCADEGYDYGTCQETTETKGFCSGDDNEVVYGFSQCEDEGLERCCCGYEDDTASTSEASNLTAGESGTTEPVEVNWPKALFLPLLVIVIILGALVYVLPKKKKDEEELL